MPRTVRFGPIMLVAVSCLAAAGFAVGAARVPCDARPGSTMLEDAAGRVFRSHGVVYSCARGSRAAYRLLDHSDPSRGIAYHLRRQQLIGHFVAWEEINYTTVATLQDLYVLDLKTGRRRRVEVGDTQFDDIGDWGLNPRGAVVFIAYYAGAHNTSEVRANNAHRTSTLAQGTFREFSSLGISVSGDRAYWLDNGVAKSAQIP